MDFWLPLIAPPLIMMVLASWVTAAMIIDGMADDMFWGEGFWLKRWFLLARKHPMLKWVNLVGLAGLALVALGYIWLAISDRPSPNRCALEPGPRLCCTRAFPG